MLRLIEEERIAGRLSPNGSMQDSCGRGSTIIILKKRSLLYKFFNGMMRHPDQFYMVLVDGNSVRLSLNNMSDNISYTLKNAAYQIVVNRLREKYNWQIYNNVDLD